MISNPSDCDRPLALIQVRVFERLVHRIDNQICHRSLSEVGNEPGGGARNDPTAALEFDDRFEPLFNSISVDAGVEEMTGPWITGFGHRGIAEQGDDGEITFSLDRYTQRLPLLCRPDIALEYRVTLMKHKGRSQEFLAIGSAQEVVVSLEGGTGETEEGSETIARKGLATDATI